MLPIQTFSLLSRISIQMLNRYKKIGVLLPSRVDPDTGDIFYGVEQLSLAAKIEALRNVQYNFSAIREILRQFTDNHSLNKYLTEQYGYLKRDSSVPTEHLVSLQKIIWQLEHPVSSVPIELKTLPSRYVASIHRIVSAYHREPLLWELLHEETLSQNVEIASPLYRATVFFDDGYRDNSAELEIQVAVNGQHRDTTNVRFKNTRSFTYASAIQSNLNFNLCEINQQLARWVIENGYKIDGHPFHIHYLKEEGYSLSNYQPTLSSIEICLPIQ